jgi:hypothetical protein
MLLVLLLVQLALLMLRLVLRLVLMLQEQPVCSRAMVCLLDLLVG